MNIAVGLVKTKLAALWLGPAGLGLIVLLQSLMTTVASLAAVSLSASGTRAVTEARTADDAARLALIRRALTAASIVLGLVGAAGFWLLRGEIPRWIGAAPNDPLAAEWLAAGIFITIAAQAPSALLIGFQRIGDLARASVFAVLIGSLAGIAALRVWGLGGITAFVLAPPFTSYLANQYYAMRLPKAAPVRASLAALAGQVKSLLGFGAALTVAAAAANASQLAARAMIQHDLGAASVGLFQAAWLISMTYIGFVLQAMGTDFYPRITAARNDPETFNRLVNEQTEVALLLAAPVMLAMLGGASLIVKLLYSSAFLPALPVLQWQIVADALKIASWPLGFALLGLGRSRTYMACEVGSAIVLLGVLWLALPIAGLQAAGIAVFAMYAFYLPIVFFFVHRRIGLRWSRPLKMLFAAVVGAAAGVALLANASHWAGAVAGALLAGAFGVLAIYRLRHAMPGPVERAARNAARLFGRG